MLEFDLDIHISDKSLKTRKFKANCRAKIIELRKLELLESDSPGVYRITKDGMSKLSKRIFGRTEQINEDILFDEDESVTFNKKIPYKINKIRRRNIKAVKKLKKLYKNKCQISNYDYTFKKEDGKWYTEGHHIVPLGKKGADSVRNIVVLSPLIHRMLHHGKIEGLCIKNIKNNKLTFKINGKKHTITYLPNHGKIVRDAARDKYDDSDLLYDLDEGSTVLDDLRGYTLCIPPNYDEEWHRFPW